MTSRATRSPVSAARADSMRAAVADALGMERILIHPLAGVLSAYGIGIADVKAIREASLLKPLGEDFSEALARAGTARTRCADRTGRRRRSDRAATAARGCATAGSDTTLEIAARDRRTRCARTSRELHHRRFGYCGRGRRGDRRRAGRGGGRTGPSRRPFRVDATSACRMHCARDVSTGPP